jgi:hypothetical protein
MASIGINSYLWNLTQLRCDGAQYDKTFKKIVIQHQQEDHGAATRRTIWSQKVWKYKLLLTRTVGTAEI